jgi:RimJ/RimL family protein N-acetyltransferase
MKRARTTKPDREWFSPGKVVKTFRARDGTDVTFRYPKPSDARQAMSYINSLVEEKAFLAKQKSVTLEEERKWLGGIMKDMRGGKTVFIVAEAGGKFAGSASVMRKPNDAFSHVCDFGIALAKPWRGKGIGTRLTETLLQQARDVLGCTIVELGCFEPNAAAKGLYEKTGFREVGRIPGGWGHYGRYYDHVLMAREAPEATRQSSRR